MLKEFEDGRKSFEKDGRTKVCFFHDQTQCKGKIKKAHSLQENGVLNIIASEVDGNKVVYCFQRMEKNPFDQYLGFEKIGKVNASTFFGFCDKHDTTLFQKIENNPVNIIKDEHKFLLCYRAAARSYHRKIEQVASFQNSKLYNHQNLKKDQQSGIVGSQAAVDELEEHKPFLNNILQSNNFNELRYLTHIIDYQIPIACTSVMTPKVYLDNSIFNFSDDPKVKYEHVYLTVLPTKTNTQILYACIPSHTKSMKFIDDLEQLSPDVLRRVTCSLMVNEIENGFISPKIFDKLTEEEKTKLIEAIELSDKIGFMSRQFYHLGFNFFDPKFKN
ncbi:MAG: hypothetical protein IPQ18_04025 [Saprospiraceae bacterium]|nr:hypothetical protein [Saprospiraceae bacterium]